MDKLTLKYGKTSVSFSIKNKYYEILKSAKIEPASDPEQYLASVIDKPLGCPPLDQIFFADDRILIVVSDITRSTGAEFFLPILLQRLNKIGILDDQISILFALGIHRGLTSIERKTIVGDEVARRIEMLDHDPDNRDEMEYIGETLRGTPLLINRNVLKADGIILTGNITFHYLAGFGGGGKSLLPGVAARESCMAFHKLILKSAGYGTKSKTYAGQMENNPMHEDILETVNKLSPDFLINTITNSSGEIIHAAAGELKEAHNKGCNFFMNHCSVHIREKADLVIVSCGGSPRDINFIQTHKSIEHAFQAVKEGGVMIVLAECAEGFGNATFLNWFQHTERESFLQNLHTAFEINGQTAFSTYLKAKAVKIILVSSLAKEDIISMNLIPAANIQEALSKSEDFLDGNDFTYIIPDGAHTLPIYKSK
tara:strand:+ start:2636 stop:3916 length:1281 start_codon:yes stop_codon:yes gene_type:complete